MRSLVANSFLVVLALALPAYALYTNISGQSLEETMYSLRVVQTSDTALMIGFWAGLASVVVAFVSTLATRSTLFFPYLAASALILAATSIASGYVGAGAGGGVLAVALSMIGRARMHVE